MKKVVWKTLKKTLSFMIWTFPVPSIMFLYFSSYLSVFNIDTIDFYKQFTSYYVPYITLLVGILTAYLVFVSLFNKVVFLERLNYYKDKIRYKSIIKQILFIGNTFNIVIMMLLRIIPNFLSDYLLIIYSLVGTICVCTVIASLGYVLILVINYNQLIKVSNGNSKKISDFHLFFLKNSEPEIFRDLILRYDQSRFSLQEHEINKTLINRNFIKYITNNSNNPKADLKKLIVDLINERTNMSIFPYDILNKLLFVYFNDYEVLNIKEESEFCDFIVEHKERKNNYTEFIIVDSLPFETLHKMFEIKLRDVLENNLELYSLKTRWWNSLFFRLYFLKLKKLDKPDADYYYNEIYTEIKYNRHQRQFDLLLLVLTYAAISENEQMQNALLNILLPKDKETISVKLNLKSLEGMKYLSFYDGIFQRTNLKGDWNKHLLEYFEENIFWFMFYEKNEFCEFELKDLRILSKNYQNGRGVLDHLYLYEDFYSSESLIANKIVERYYSYVSNNIEDFYNNKTKILDSIFSLEDNICLDFSKSKDKLEEIIKKILSLSQNGSILDSENKVTKEFKAKMPKLNDFILGQSEVSQDLEKQFNTPEIDTPVEIKTLKNLLYETNSDEDYENKKRNVYGILEYVIGKKYPTSYNKNGVYILANSDSIILQNQGDEKDYHKFNFYLLVIQIGIRYRDEVVIKRIKEVRGSDFYIVKSVLRYLIVFKQFRDEMKEFKNQNSDDFILFFKYFVSITDVIKAFSNVNISSGIDPDKYLNEKMKEVYGDFPEWFENMKIEKINDYKVLYQLFEGNLADYLYEFEITDRNTYKWHNIDGLLENEISSLIRALSRKQAYVNCIFLDWISNKYSSTLNDEILNYFVKVLENKNQEYIFTDDSIRPFLEKIENSKLSRDTIKSFLPFVKYDKFQRMLMDTKFMKQK